MLVESKGIPNRIARDGAECARPDLSPSAIRRRLDIAAGHAYMYFVAFLDSEGRRCYSRLKCSFLRCIIVL